MGIAVTKVKPIVENIQGIKVKNQNFSVPLKFIVENNIGTVVNNPLPPSSDYYISIPNIKRDKQKLINLLFASGAFPGAFQQVKLDYTYKGKRASHYFIDGGLYDNVPLELAIALDENSSTFFFMDPSNMRKENPDSKKIQKEKVPLGFIKTNLLSIFNTFDIMQTMKLYESINRNFRGKSDKKLILSSRFHPITGKFLGHFGAFLDQNFRTYDYYVGIYDAIYHITAAFKRYHPEAYKSHNQLDIMNYFKSILEIDKHPEALSIYNLLQKTEFKHYKPQTHDRFSAIYNSFDLTLVDEDRYSNDSFKEFLSKLNMNYIQSPPNGFLNYAKEDIDNWYKRPLRFIVNRIASIESDSAAIDDEYTSIATLSNLGVWASSSLLEDKRGLDILPFNVPYDIGKDNLRQALRFLPTEISINGRYGGASLGYSALYYTSMDMIDGFEAKASYVIGDDVSDALRVDFGVFSDYGEYMKFGGGISLFGDMDGDFYKSDSAFGFNAYLDFMDIFRITYVNRQGDNTQNKHSVYIGVENIPALIYWLNR